VSNHRLDFERDIKRDIRNNPIVREIDQDRQRELWRSVAIGVVLVTVLLFSAGQHFELLRHGYRIEQLQEERALELELNRHLRLEIATLKSPRRIEQIATERLNLVAPGSEDAVVLARVFPSPAPGPGIVADRRVETFDETEVETPGVGVRR
jgi:cell division protein FtsL